MVEFLEAVASWGGVYYYGVGARGWLVLTLGIGCLVRKVWPTRAPPVVFEGGVLWFQTNSRLVPVLASKPPAVD